MRMRICKAARLRLRCGRWVVVFAACLLMAGISCRPDAERGRVEWQPQPLSRHVEPSFDLRFGLDAGPGSSVRLVFGSLSRAERSYLELGPSGIVYGATGAGLERGRVVVNRTPLVKLADKKLVFQRRPHRWSLIADGRIVAKGDNPPEVGKEIGFAAAQGHVALRNLRFQRVHGIYFADGFMRTAEEPTSWEEIAGTWKFNVLHNPLLSANAFYYSGSATPAETAAGGTADPPRAIALVGDRFWSDAAVSVACRPAEKGAVGLYLCHRGPKDYYLFRWSSRDSKRPVRQFIRRLGDEERILAEAPGGYEPGAWYVLKALLGSGWVRFEIDGARGFLVHDPGLTYGRIGLYVEGKAFTSFDDVVVQSRPARCFAAGGNCLGRRLTTGGRWMQVAPAEWDTAEWGGGIVVNAPKRAALLWEDPAWRNFAVSARLGPWRKGTLGLFFRYADERNHYSVRWKKTSTPVIQICRTQKGKSEVLAEREVPEDGRPHRLGVASEEGEIAVSVDDRPLLRTADFAFLGSRAGLYAEAVSLGSFSEVIYETLPGHKPMRTTTEAFSAEQSMQIWSGVKSDWAAIAYNEGLPQPVTLWWHRSDFHGDLRLDMRMKEPPAPGAEVGLLVNGDGLDIKNGYLLRVRGGESEKDLPVAELLVSGEGVRKTTLSWKAGPRILGIRRTGKRLSAFLGDKLICSLPDADPGKGRRLGWYACKAAVTRKEIDLYSNNIINYAFKSAPSDWRPGGGIWEVTNKWQCDPRWSFFSGRSPKAASLWYKRPLRGDFTIEHFVGVKMARERGNPRLLYQYAQDLNLSFCADGEDLNAGYSFIFGGHNNTRTSLYRKGVEWDKTSRILINQKGLHRKWYHIKVARKGRKLDMHVDGVLVFSKVDENPLKDGHFAIWTYNNGIMIGRVRVSAEEIGPRDSPDRVWAPATQSIYVY